MTKSTEMWFRTVIFVFVLCSFLILPLCRASNDGIINPNWVKPGAIDRHGQMQRLSEQGSTPDGGCTCPSAPICELEPPQRDPLHEDNKLALVFYRKFVTSIFARADLEADEFEGNFLSRTLRLKISERQLRQLFEEAHTAREIDSIVSDVFEQSRKADSYRSMQESACQSIIASFRTLNDSQLFLYGALPTIVLIGVSYLVRAISRLTRIHPMLVVVLLVLCTTLLMSWFECNEQLARQSMQNFKAGKSAAGMTQRTVCDPSEVVVNVVAKLQMLYFKNFVQHFIDIYQKQIENAGWLEALIISLFLLGLAYIIVTSVVQSTVYGSFNFVGGLFGGSHRGASQNAPPVTAPNATDSQVPPPAYNFHISINNSRAKKKQRVAGPADNNRVEELTNDDGAARQAIDQAPQQSQDESDGSSDIEHVEIQQQVEQMKKIDECAEPVNSATDEKGKLK